MLPFESLAARAAGNALSIEEDEDGVAVPQPHEPNTITQPAATIGRMRMQLLPSLEVSDFAGIIRESAEQKTTMSRKGRRRMMSRAILSRIILILAISCLAIFSACRSDAKSAILGKWRDESSNEAMQFSADDKVTVTTGQIIITGAYSFPDSAHLVFEFNSVGALANPVVMEYALSSDELKLTSSVGKVVLYRRVR
jgi:hypothetical protein